VQPKKPGRRPQAKTRQAQPREHYLSRSAMKNIPRTSIACVWLSLFSLATAYPCSADTDQIVSSPTDESNRNLWNQRLNIATIGTSLPFGWLNNVFSGYSFLSFGYSILIPIKDVPNVAVLLGGDIVELQGASYREPIGQDTLSGIYTSIPVRLNLSIASGYRRLYADIGINPCFPVFVLFDDSKAPTGIHGMYWQSHYGLSYCVTKYLDLGLRMNLAITRFDAGDGKGFDNSLTLTTSLRF
jgi:hypothetical protein